MKHTLFHTLVAVITMLLAACSSTGTSNSGITDQGINPIVLGAKISDLPDQVNNLYDSFEVIIFEDTETGFLPSRTYAQFKRNEQIVIEADLNLDDAQTIESIAIFDPAITYKGLGPGTPIFEMLKTEAKLYLTGNYSSCFFDAYFQLDNIYFAFDFLNGKSFSRTGKSRIINREFTEPTEFPLAAPDFEQDAVISKICIYPR